jgi:hypothetical protein
LSTVKCGFGPVVTMVVPSGLCDEVVVVTAVTVADTANFKGGLAVRGRQRGKPQPQVATGRYTGRMLTISKSNAQPAV